jgi:hypothetical protein
MLRLDRNSLNTEEKRPFVKMSANCDVIETWSTRTDLTDNDSLSDKMKINLNMFDALMLNEVCGEVHDADIIAVDESALRRRILELMEQQAQPGGLSHTVGDGMVLGFCAGPRDDRLSLGRPGHQVVPEEHRVAGCRATSVRTSSPVSVGVHDKVGEVQAARKETVIWHPLEVAQDVFHGRQMRLPRVVHVQTNLLYSVGDVGSSERQVLQGACDASELGGILDRRS